MSDEFMIRRSYESLIYEQGIFYPIIFLGEKGKSSFYSIFMPVKDINENYDIGMADSFEKAYEIAQNYLRKYVKINGRCPKYVNPYNIDIDEDEILVMVKYN